MFWLTAYCMVALVWAMVGGLLFVASHSPEDKKEAAMLFFTTPVWPLVMVVGFVRMVREMIGALR